MSDFIAVWSAYPVKKNKALAKKRFDALPGSAQAAVLADVTRRVEGEWRTADPTYIPHLSTYLSRKRWEDEAPPVKSDAPVHVPSNGTETRETALRALDRDVQRVEDAWRVNTSRSAVLDKAIKYRRAEIDARFPLDASSPVV